MDKITV